MVRIVLLNALIFVLVLIWNLSSSERSDKDAENVSFISYLSYLKLPDELEFCGERVPLENPIVRERAEREFYINLQQPGQLILYLKRTTRFFPIFDSIFQRYAIPDDIKYLAVAESGLQNSRSPKQALGIWQFIPTTAREYGMIVNDSLDERLNIYKSTESACRYLVKAYQKFGSWSLASAAYNMGFTNLSANLAFQGVDNYYDLFLNEETSRYIFRIVILKEILKNWRKYGFKLNPEDFYLPFKTRKIVWDKAIPDLALWAKQQNTNYFMVKLLNPWILKQSLPKPKDFYVIDIPQD